MNFPCNITTLRLLVHVHIYHAQHYPELRRCLANLKGLNFDLYVSMSDWHSEIADDIKAFKKDAFIFQCPNRGYDVAPFLDVLHRVNLSKYDLVIKLHTKRDTPVKRKLIHIDINYRWREYLLTFISNPQSLQNNLKAFIKNTHLGMIAHYRLLLTERRKRHADPKKNLFLQTLLFMKEKLNLDPIPAEQCHYVGGTMFMARASIFEPLKHIDIGYDDFVTADANNKDEYDLAHIFERVFGWLVTSQILRNNDHYIIDDPFSNPIKKAVWPVLKLADHIYKKIIKFVYRKNGNSIRFLKIITIKISSDRETKA